MPYYKPQSNLFVAALFCQSKNMLIKSENPMMPIQIVGEWKNEKLTQSNGNNII